MPSMEVQEYPVFEVERGQTHRHTDRNFSKPFTVTLPKGEDQLETNANGVFTYLVQQQLYKSQIATFFKC